MPAINKQTLVKNTGSGSANDKGFFATSTALTTAFPTGVDGWYATVGATDTLWVWDSGTSVWVNSGGSGAGAVTSVFGRTGAIVATAGDYNATQITNTPAGNISATTVQAAINELDTEKARLSGGNVFTGDQTFDTDTLFIDSVNNRVGFGTVSPSRRVSINEGVVAANYNGGITMSQDSAGNVGTAGYELSLLNSTQNITAQLRGARTAASAFVGVELNTTGRDGLRIQTGLTSSSEVMRINNSGNVGIGTTTLTEKLNVNGNVAVTGNISATGTLGGSNFSGSSSGTNTGDNAPNSLYSGLATSKQDSDAGLTSISGLTGSGYMKATATDTYSLVTSIPNTDLANSSITIAGTSTSLGGSITQDTITGLSATGLIKRTGANTLAIATAGTDYVTPTGTETLTNKTLTTPVLNGTPTGTGVSQPSSPSTLVLRNSDGDIRTLKYTSSITSTATSGGTLALSNSSAQVQRFTGTSNHTVTLWSNGVVSVSTPCVIINDSTGTITVQTSTAVALGTVAPGQKACFLSLTTGNTASDWARFDNISLTTTGTSGAATLTNGVLNIPNYATGGDFSSNTATSVDGEVVLFSGTGGKTGKRATGTGIAKLTSGVLGTATAGTDYAPATTGSSILYGNGAGGFSSVTIGSGLSFSAGTLSATGGGGGLSDGDYGDVTVSGGGSIFTIDEPALRKSETSVNNQPTFTAINKFDTLQTNFYGNGTVALETSLQAEGTGAMKLTLATAGVCGPRLALASATNFALRAFTIKCRASAWANISSAEILFATEAGFTNYYLWQWKGGTNGKLVTPPDNEWIERVFNPGDCAVGAGTPNWNAITHIIIRAQASSGTPDFYVDDFKHFASTQIPTICVTFDDGLLTQFTNGKAKLDQYDIKATFYSIWDLVGQTNYMTQSNFDTLSVQGHDISGHGQTNLTTLSSAQQITDLIGMKKWLVTNGYRGANNYALPNGAYTDAVLANVRKYFNSIANIDWLSNSKEYSPNYLINRFSPDSTTSTATIQAWIDNAIANNNMAIIAWHGIVASGATGAQVNQSTYDTIMDYIGTKKAAAQIQTATLTDYYASDSLFNDVITAVPTGPGQDNWAPAGFSPGVGSFKIKMRPTGPVWITGLTAGKDGQSVTLYNDSAFIIGLCHDVSSTAANRFSTRRKTNWLLPRESADLVYDSTISRWVVVGDTFDVLDINPNMNLITAAGAATPSAYNVAVTNTATVASVAANTTPTDDFNEQISMSATNSTASGSAGTFATSGLFARGATTGRGGIVMTGQVRFTALGATGGVMVGLTSSTAAITAQPSTLTQCLLLGANGGQTTLRIFSGNATAGTPVDLGANFPTPSATAAYEYFFHLPPNDTVGYYMVRRLDSHFVAAGSVASSPTNTTLVGPRATVMVGATAVANTLQYTYMATRRIMR